MKTRYAPLQPAFSGSELARTMRVLCSATGRMLRWEEARLEGWVHDRERPGRYLSPRGLEIDKQNPK